MRFPVRTGMGGRVAAEKVGYLSKIDYLKEMAGSPVSDRIGVWRSLHNKITLQQPQSAQ